MVHPPLRCLQRMSFCWGAVLSSLREPNGAKEGSFLRVAIPGASAPSSRMIHNPADLHSTGRSPSHYDVLKVTPNATQEQIKKAYYKMSLENHPDLHGGSVEASEKFRSISEAYEVLGDPLKRSNYDAVYGVHTPNRVSEPAESIFRRPRRTGQTRYNINAWEEAHYGDSPDWRRAHNPHNWRRRTHGPRVSPFDDARFWEEEMAGKYGAANEAEMYQQRRTVEELRNMHRSAIAVFMGFFFIAAFLNVAFSNPRDRYGDYFDLPDLPVDRK